MPDNRKSPVPEPETEIVLSFEGDTVRSDWYHPKMEPILCSLCGKNCKDKTVCYSTNPYCG